MVCSSQSKYRSLIATAVLVLLPLAGTEAIAAPANLSWNPSQKTVSYTAKGYSQVEYKWPKSGVVCRHNQSTSRRTSGNLTNIRFGLNTGFEYFMAWDRIRSPSWIQL